MKKNVCLFCLLFVFMSNGLSAQTPQPALPRDFSRRVSIDTASLCVTYSCLTRTVLHMKAYVNDMQVLEKGNSYCRYYSKYAELTDSLYVTNNNMIPVLGRNENGIRKEGIYEDIFMGYPRKGEMSVFTRFMKKNFVYRESVPTLKWRLLSETDTILGYKCIKAEADFRGRVWYAWFTPDIPVNLGPWKLSGLPGLILKAEDSDGYFTYEAVGILQNSKTPIMMYNERSQKCKREDVLNLNDLRWKDDMYLQKMMSGVEAVSFQKNEFGNAVRSNGIADVVIPQREME